MPPAPRPSSSSRQKSPTTTPEKNVMPKLTTSACGAGQSSFATGTAFCHEPEFWARSAQIFFDNFACSHPNFAKILQKFISVTAFETWLETRNFWLKKRK